MDLNNTVIPAKKGGMRKMILGNLCILVATIFFGVDVPVVKLLIPTWMNAMDVTAFRMLGACLLLWITSLFVKRESIDKSDWPKLILGGAIGLFSFIFLFNLSLHYSNPIDVSIIMTMPPAFVVLINVMFKSRRPSLMEYGGLGLSFLGAFIVISLQHSDTHGSNELLGDIIALISALCYALYLVITEGPSKKYNPVSMLKWTYLFASIPALFLVPDLVHARICHTAQWQPWVLIGFVVVFVSYVSYFLLAPAEKMISSELVSIYQYLLPVFASIASLAFGIAKINWIQVLAMIVIVAGMVISNVGKFRRKKAHQSKLTAHGISDPEVFAKGLQPLVDSLKTNANTLSKEVRKIEESTDPETLNLETLNQSIAAGLQSAQATEKDLGEMGAKINLKKNPAE